MKTLLMSWISFSSVALRKSSVELDVKVDVMNMCFCLIGIVKISQVEIENKLQSLCTEVEVGIQNIILAHTSSVRMRHVLGHGVNVKEELEVCFHRITYVVSESMDLSLCTVTIAAGVEFHAF